jgi:hypothetical protein
MKKETVEQEQNWKNMIETYVLHDTQNTYRTQIRNLTTAMELGLSEKMNGEKSGLSVLGFPLAIILS